MRPSCTRWSKLQEAVRVWLMCQPQYGCYGEILAPILWAFGTGPFVITAVFGVMFLFAVAMILTASRQIVEHPVVLAVLSIWLLFLSSMIIFFGSTDPYFAYYPIRVIFPAIAFYIFTRVDT